MVVGLAGKRPEVESSDLYIHYTYILKKETLLGTTELGGLSAFPK